MRRRWLVVCAVVLVAFVASCREQPTAPTSESPSSVVEPSFSFTGGSGTLLGTTDEGELVRVSLDSGTVVLIGDAGVVGGHEIPWRDLAFTDPDTLYALSYHSTDTHLYRIDPETGAVLEARGPVAATSVEDLAFANDTLYANGCCSRIFGWIDPSIPVLTWISPVNAFTIR